MLMLFECGAHSVELGVVLVLLSQRLLLLLEVLAGVLNGLIGGYGLIGVLTLIFIELIGDIR